MLHIVNGDSVGDKLRKGNIRGDVLVWREVYPAGPTFVKMEEPGARAARAAYLERTMGIPADEYTAACASQERTLQRFRQYDEVVLWFEHDLFDQLMLGYLLHWFSRQELGDTKLNLLCIGAYPGVERFRGLGQLTAAQLESLVGTWKRIGQRELETGKRIWEAYASPNVEDHAAMLREDTSALPFAQAALDMHMSRLPAAPSGLGIVEQTVLELVRDGTNTPLGLFKAVGERLSLLGMGDLEFWYRLRQMAEPRVALIEIRNPSALPGDSENVAALTEMGRNVAAGVQIGHFKGMDEWYGGPAFA
ncbi:DUF1835 domain-containing protein [Cohnella rhizosphaerae]|uniref:DUF1835 domain-containing protein n=1 Tax=Cohnella rhizosphaerae TaxID=1457232 RepID=A0A9X4KVR7_9BACL|nr:DUF1835 domain-containing protein [Cohnella rhizosphaerae]MDG0811313.1 DUF1835 domain-containing protein [Cohnella rhizosphaerae]